MSAPLRLRRPLGTMVAFGFPGLPFSVDLKLASVMGARVVEILPRWESRPDPRECGARTSEAGLSIQGAHGSWGSRSITGTRVDLASLDESTRAGSVEDIRRCLDWIAEAGGRHLVVHPGGLSNQADHERRSLALSRSLSEVANHAGRLGLIVCVENMPPGVHPGSRMSDLARLLDDLGRDELALVLDTGHAQLGHGAAAETLAAGSRLKSLHVHDNDGRSDAHWIPGEGVVDWPAWREALDDAGYAGPIMLECIRRIRDDPGRLGLPVLTLLADLTDDPLVAEARDAFRA